MRPGFLLIAMVIGLFAADGVWTGKWSSSQNENAGGIRIKLKPEAEVVFTINDREVKTKIAAQKLEEANFTIDYDFDLSGYSLRSSLSGTIKGDTAEGTYKTKSLADGAAVDEGTFKASISK